MGEKGLSDISIPGFEHLNHFTWGYIFLGIDRSIVVVVVVVGNVVVLVVIIFVNK